MLLCHSGLAGIFLCLLAAYTCIQKDSRQAGMTEIAISTWPFLRAFTKISEEAKKGALFAESPGGGEKGVKFQT